MRDKQQVQENIERWNKDLLQLPELGTARLLRECRGYALFNELKNYQKGYRLGHFEFSVYPHDTGIDYKISVVAPDETTLVIRHINFSYGGNDTVHTRLYGAWDKPLEFVIEQLRDKQKQYILNKLEELNELLEVFKREETTLKNKFEAVFK